MNHRWVTITGTWVIVLSITGCGLNPKAHITNQPAPVASQHANDLQSTLNPPFENKLNVRVTTPDPKFDPTLTHGGQVTVLSSTGKTVSIDLTEQPVLFEAYWCPHCQRTLVLFDKNKQLLKQPIIVATGFVPNTPLETAVSLVSQEEQELRIHFEHVYYLLDNNELRRLVHQYPTLYFPYHGKVEILSGEHTIDVWQKALGLFGYSTDVPR